MVRLVGRSRVAATLREIALRSFTRVGRGTRQESRQGEVRIEVQRDVKKRRSRVHVCRMCVLRRTSPGYVFRDRDTPELERFSQRHTMHDTNAVLQDVLLFAYDIFIRTWRRIYFSQCCSQPTRHSPRISSCACVRLTFRLAKCSHRA